jgi:hypothetical protein
MVIKAAQDDWPVWTWRDDLWFRYMAWRCRIQQRARAFWCGLRGHIWEETGYYDRWSMEGDSWVECILCGADERY